jgi:hypothetical protein
MSIPDDADKNIGENLDAAESDPTDGGDREHRQDTSRDSGAHTSDGGD